MFYIDWMLTLVVFVVYPFAALPVTSIGKRVKKRPSAPRRMLT